MACRVGEPKPVAQAPRVGTHKMAKLGTSAARAIPARDVVPRAGVARVARVAPAWAATGALVDVLVALLALTTCPFRLPVTAVA